MEHLPDLLGATAPALAQAFWREWSFVGALRRVRWGRGEYLLHEGHRDPWQEGQGMDTSDVHGSRLVLVFVPGRDTDRRRWRRRVDGLMGDSVIRPAPPRSSAGWTVGSLLASAFLRVKLET